MQERLDIRSMIHEGDLDKAINKVKDIDAKVFPLNLDMKCNSLEYVDLGGEYRLEFYLAIAETHRAYQTEQCDGGT